MSPVLRRIDAAFCGERHRPWDLVDFAFGLPP
jgi:hypothetical protein